jgi:hypothetical protein
MFPNKRKKDIHFSGRTEDRTPYTFFEQTGKHKPLNRNKLTDRGYRIQDITSF